jgi:hypothetical protein
MSKAQYVRDIKTGEGGDSVSGEVGDYWNPAATIRLYKTNDDYGYVLVSSVPENAAGLAGDDPMIRLLAELVGYDIHAAETVVFVSNEQGHMLPEDALADLRGDNRFLEALEAAGYEVVEVDA